MEKVCKTCKKSFIPKDERPNRLAKFCSKKCVNTGYKFKKGHIGFIPPKRAWDNIASKTTRFKKGHKVNNGRIPWNKGVDFGGNEYTAKRISWLSKYKKWRFLIRKRDGCCVECGNKDNLHVDHYPISLAQLVDKYNVFSPQQANTIEEFWDISNGRTLCFSCHKLTATYGKNIVQKMRRVR